MSESSRSRPRRRAGDAAVVLFSGERDAEESIALDLPAFRATPEQLESAAFLIDLGSEEALLLPAWDAQLLPGGEGGAELEARAAGVALALRRERSWVKRRLAMPDFLLEYADALQAAAAEADVYDALRRVAGPVVGVYRAVVFIAVTPRPDDPLHQLGDPSLPFSLPPLPADVARRIAQPRVVTRAFLESGEEPGLEALASVLDSSAATHLFCAPVGPDALLVLLERRDERVFTGEDQALLGALLRQAESALRRIESERQVARWTAAGLTP